MWKGYDYYFIVPGTKVEIKIWNYWTYKNTYQNYLIIYAAQRSETTASSM